ncbi:hypothetical protein ACFV1F_19775 [Streptomyces sp. NPDC059590]|uniref:hypothetical protein n=1 Tax=Streptomyces sp. NPDC059590 TaxID=3346877 RepID=UPI00369A80C4
MGVTNTFALPRLLPMSDRNKDAEILTFRHQITVLERQLSDDRAQFTPGDRAFLAVLLHRLALPVLRRVRLLVRPDTVLRRHRSLASTAPGEGVGWMLRSRSGRLRSSARVDGV